METMKAVRIHSYGAPEVLVYEDVPKPSPTAEEILVRVHAAAINPVDWQTREGLRQEIIPLNLPAILGWDISGVVEAKGSNIKGFNIGSSVYAMPGVPCGGYAEYAVVRPCETAAKPNLLDYVQAASVPLPALTAWQSLFDTPGLCAGQSVLIHAGSGGVGIAVQFAKAKGAHVIGTASSKNQDFVRQLGADEVIDYTKSRFEDTVREVDVVLDLIGGETQERSWQTLKKGGVLVGVIPDSRPSAQTAATYGVRGIFFSVKPNADDLREIAKLIDAGQVKPIVETVLPLAEARRAHEISQSGHTRGKIVLQVGV